MENLKMQSPWVSFYDKIRELFKRDNEIKLTWDDDTCILNMYVDNPNKARVLTHILPTTKAFGNVTMTINVIPSNSRNMQESNKNSIDIAFTGNPIFHYSRTFEQAFMTNNITYVVFAKEVIQYFNDDLGDLFGNANCLAEDIARAVFVNVEGIFFCTDVK